MKLIRTKVILFIPSDTNTWLRFLEKLRFICFSLFWPKKVHFKNKLGNSIFLFFFFLWKYKKSHPQKQDILEKLHKCSVLPLQPNDSKSTRFVWVFMVLGIYNFGSYIPLLGDLGMMPFSFCDTCFLLALERLERKNTHNKYCNFFSGQKDRDLFSIDVLSYPFSTEFTKKIKSCSTKFPYLSFHW